MILEDLRLHTRPYHEKIERNPLLSSLTAPELAQKKYVSILKRFYGFFRPMEESLIRECGQSDFQKVIERRCKTPLLQKDLAYFEGDSGGAYAIPVCTNLPRLDTRAKQLGFLYVSEGSTLGGQVITKALKSSIGISVNQGGAFFDGYGPQTRAMWEETCRIIVEGADALGSKRSQIVSAAVETFDKLHKWFEKGGERER